MSFFRTDRQTSTAILWIGPNTSVSNTLRYFRCLPSPAGLAWGPHLAIALPHSVPTHFAVRPRKILLTPRNRSSHSPDPKNDPLSNRRVSKRKKVVPSEVA